jgi:adenylate cyclase
VDLLNGSRLALRVAVLGSLASVLLVSGAFERFELQALNAQFHLRGSRPSRAPIVLVAIDEDDFDELNIAWPFPRKLHAQLLDILHAARPAAIGMDLLFTEPSLFGREDDAILSQAVATAGNVVLAADITEVTDGRVTKSDLNPPLPEVRAGAAGFGPVNFARDEDAFVRSGALTQTHQRRVIPGFDLLLYRLAADAGIPVAPLPTENVVWINFRGGPGTFRTVSYHRVLSHEVSPEAFAGKIVLVGATSPALHDVFPTPFAPQGTMPGVELHANLLETLLQGIALRRVPRAAMLAAMFAASLLVLQTAERLRPLAAFGLVSSAGLLWVTGGFVAFAIANIWVDQVPIPLILLSGYATAVFVNFLRERREKQRLSRFFSPAVASEIVRHRHEHALDSSRRTITVLFSDLRNFTSISERLEPEEVAELLRDYLTGMTEAVFTHGGTVDKFVGDAVMALFNAPVDQADHAEQAVATALDARKHVGKVSARWEARLGMPLRAGVGIHTGDAVVGTLGSAQRLEYTAIGDTVNVASRVEGLTKELDAPVVVSESTWAAVQHRVSGRFLGSVPVKGRREPVKVYAVDGWREETSPRGEHP